MLGSTFRRLLSYVPGRSRSFFIAATSGFVGGIGEAMATVAIVRVATGLSKGKDRIGNLPGPLGAGTVGSGLLVAFLFTLVAVAAHLASNKALASAQSGTLFNAREKALDAFSRANWAVQSEQRDGALQEMLTVHSGSIAHLTAAFSSLSVSSLTIITTLCVALFVDPIATVVVVGGGVLLTLPLRPLSRNVRRRARMQVALNEDFAEEVHVRARMAMETRLFGVAQQARDILTSINRREADQVGRVRFSQRTSAVLQRDIAVVAVIIGLAVVQSLSADALIATGTVVLLMIRSLQAAQSAQLSVQHINEYSSSLEVYERRLAVLSQGLFESGDRKIAAFDGLRLVDVSYTYPSGHDALRDVNLELRFGDMVGVVGPSGGGKSTLKQVMSRLRLPSSGQVLVNGVPYTEFDEESWSKLVSFVPQSPQLFPGTIKENIRFLRNEVDDARIIECAKAANIHEDIQSFPDGYETVLGPGGSGLSGGQRQRVGIARALASSPQLLILDEPTSALDRNSEEMIKKAIRELKGRMTLVIIAHRISTLEACDSVVTVEKGRIVGVSK